MTDAPRRWNTARRTRAIFARETEFPWHLRLLRRLGRSRWLPFGQDRLLRLIHDPETSPHFLFEVDFFGQLYRGDLAHYIDWLVFCYGGAPYYELSLLKEAVAFLRSRRRGPIGFFDIGANVGHHSLFMATLADRVIAFEPMPDLVALIEEKIQINRLTNVEVVPVAMGDADEDGDYLVGRGANSGEGSFLPHGEFDRGSLIKLPIRQGDRLCEAKRLPRVDLVKVDVEGFEPQVFRGLAGSIRRDRPIILTELSDNARRGFGTEEGFRAAFYESAHFTEVGGGFSAGPKFRPFRFATSGEVLIVPPEFADFLASCLHG